MQSLIKVPGNEGSPGPWYVRAVAATQCVYTRIDQDTLQVQPAMLQRTANILVGAGIELLGMSMSASHKLLTGQLCLAWLLLCS